MKLFLTLSLLSVASGLWSQLEIVWHRDGLCPNDRILLVAVGGSDEYTWINTNEPDIILSTNGFIGVYPEVPISYSVYDSTDTVTFNVTFGDTQCICQCYIPNHFTPDGDYVNQIFKPIINCNHIGLHMTIYNREQGIIYDSHDIEQFWDGTDYRTGIPLKDDVYVYQVSFVKPDGEIETRVGFVLLAR